MSELSEALRALSPQREAQFQFSASVRGGVVPDWREQFIGFFGGGDVESRHGAEWPTARHGYALTANQETAVFSRTDRVPSRSSALPASTLHAGQAQQDGPPQPPQVCPASSTPTPALVGKEFK